MKKFLLLVVLGAILFSIVGCKPDEPDKFQIMYKSCNLGQCVSGSPSWSSISDFFLSEGFERCLIGREGDAKFYAPEGHSWIQTTGDCYKPIKN